MFGLVTISVYGWITVAYLIGELPTMFMVGLLSMCKDGLLYLIGGLLCVWWVTVPHRCD